MMISDFYIIWRWETSGIWHSLTEVHRHFRSVYCLHHQAISTSEMSVHFNVTTWRYNPDTLNVTASLIFGSGNSQMRPLGAAPHLRYQLTYYYSLGMLNMYVRMYEWMNKSQSVSNSFAMSQIKRKMISVSLVIMQYRQWKSTMFECLRRQVAGTESRDSRKGALERKFASQYTLC
jgi:hypothetical protein